MEMHTADYIRSQLMDKGLKVTPQRVAVMEAIVRLKSHPTADRIRRYVQKSNPNLASGTVYNVLEIFVENGMVRRIKTERDVMRYDSIMEDHHHLYCEATDRIEDYFDEELDRVLRSYFERKSIPNFRIRDIKLQLSGEFIDTKSKSNN